MSHVVDARGLSCPEPVILTKNALQEHDDIIVIVDNTTAFENVKRMAGSQGCTSSVEHKEEGIFIHVLKQKEMNNNKCKSCNDNSNLSSTVFVFSNNRMGEGNEELGSILIKAFVQTITQMTPLPGTLIFYNAGVKLTVESSAVVEDIKLLEEHGVKVLVCGTCLNFYELKEIHKAGTVSNMYDIIDTMLLSDKVITI